MLINYLLFPRTSKIQKTQILISIETGRTSINVKHEDLKEVLTKCVKRRKWKFLNEAEDEIILKNYEMKNKSSKRM